MIGDPVVEVDNLAHTYGTRPALRGISFQVGKGEIFGLLGPNGGGKTTLFRILATLLRPCPPSSGLTGGTARLFGHSLEGEARAIRARIGVVFQAPSLDLKLTVAENLRHQGHLYGLSGAPLARRIEELLRRFGLADRSGDYVETLSGGLRRRVELAKAFLHLPELLLLDEPSTGLDPGVRWELWRYLAELREKDRITILLTTHLFDEAGRCDRLAILDQGVLVALGAPAELERLAGGDVVAVEADEPESLAPRIKERFGHEPRVMDGTIRIECERGHEFIAALVEAFPGKIKSVMFRKPTLEDFFIRTTGHRFEDEEGER